MKKVVFANHVFKMHHDQDHAYMLLEWLSPVLLNEFIHAIATAEKVITENKITALIGDIRLLGALSEESVAHNNKVFVPVLEKMAQVGTILPADAFDKMIAENMLENFDTSNIKFRAFNNLEDAEAWIRKTITKPLSTDTIIL